ncbi:MAG: hypothetical protein Q8N81_07920 [bacterium]|nr:hypothetical protein [bacterium]
MSFVILSGRVDPLLDPVDRDARFVGELLNRFSAQIKSVKL